MAALETPSVDDQPDHTGLRRGLPSSGTFAQAVLDSLSAHIAILDDAGRIVAVNQAWRDFAARNPPAGRACEGADYLEVCDRARGDHSVNAPEFAMGIRRVLAGELHEFQLEYPCHSPTEQRWFSGRVTRLVGDGPQHVVVAHENVTARHLADEQLRKLSMAVEQSPSGIVITDLEGTIEFVNDAIVRDTGYGRDELLGRNNQLLDSAETPGSTYRLMMTALRRGERWSGNFQFRRKDGSDLVVRAVVSPLRNVDGHFAHYVVVLRDITQQCRLEHELEQYREHLEDLVDARTVELAEARRQAETANAGKSAFLANMSHEIRTPMNGVLGMVEVLLQDQLSAEQRDVAQMIRKSGQTLLRLIDDVLDLSKIEAGEMRIERLPVPIRSTVEGVCDALAAMAVRTDVDLSAFIAADVPDLVMSDPLRLRQVIHNLVNNAIKFSGSRPQARGRVAVRVTVASEVPLRLALVVEDNGIGMAPATVAQLFSPFSQAEVSTTRRFGGTGLGLAICRRLVNLMGGTIHVASEAAAGSRFTLDLPLERAPGEGRSSVHASLLGGLGCLLLENAEYDTLGMQHYLQAAGAAVRIAGEQDVASTFPTGTESDTVLIRRGVSCELATDSRGAALVGPGLRQVIITRGHGGIVRLDSPARVCLGGAALRRDSLVRAVAIAAGRASTGPTVLATTKSTAEYTVRALPMRVAKDAARRILVVEDDPTNRKVIGRQLALLGLTPDLAVDGEEALRRWRQQRHALVLTDLHMPKMDGYTLAAAIRRDESQTPGTAAVPPPRTTIIAITANALRGEADRARANGMDDYLTKPVELERLRQAICRWLLVDLATDPVAGSIPLEVGAGAEAILDVGVLTALIGDDPAMLREFLRGFAATATALGDDMSTAAASHRVADVVDVAHKLKSSAKSVGATGLGHCCARIEAAGRRGDLLTMQQGVTTFKSLLPAVQRAIQQYDGDTAARSAGADA